MRHSGGAVDQDASGAGVAPDPGANVCRHGRHDGRQCNRSSPSRPRRQTLLALPPEDSKILTSHQRERVPCLSPIPAYLAILAAPEKVPTRLRPPMPKPLVSKRRGAEPLPPVTM